MDFKDKIRILRKESGLTQKQAAEQIGVTYRTYQNYEAGASIPGGAALARIAEIFHISLDLLLGDIPGDAAADVSSSNGELQKLLGEMQALLYGGKLPEADKIYVMEALTDMFWRSKELNLERGQKPNTPS